MQIIKKLPAIFQTITEKKFFASTFQQCFSKKDSDMLAGFIGRRDPGSYNPVNDFYLPEPTKNRTWWQLEATAYSQNPDTTKTNIFFYEDLLNRIEYYGGNTLNQDRLFESEYYSFGPPIDYDMFINYQNYYWIEQGLTPISITGVLASSIIGQASYTTPISATPPNLKLTTGMSVILVDDPDPKYATPHIVENLGGCEGIILIEKTPDFTAGTIFEFLPWDNDLEFTSGRILSNSHWDTTTWEVQAQPGNDDYITIERGSIDKNSWSRTNKWVHVDAINATIAATGVSFPTTATRALRPIIQFVANLTLFNSGTQFRDDISYGFRDNQFGNPLLLSDFQGGVVATLNSTYSINLQDGDLVAFFNDTSTNNYIYQAVFQLGGTVLFTEYTSVATPIVEGDIVFILNNAPYDGASRGQTWYYTSGVWLHAFNDKTDTNQPPLFQLYDHNGVKLNDTSVYPGSTFEGSKIFSYKVNTRPGATVDPVLKFPIVFTALGQSSDIVFDNNLITNRYTYAENLVPIRGYYYYKTITNPILYNSWNLYDLCNCAGISPPPPVNCVEVSKQRVIDKFVVGYGSEYKFKLSVTPFGYPASPDIVVSVNGIEVKSLANQLNGYTFVTINNKIYVDLTAYLTSLLIVSQTQPPVVEVQTYTHNLLDPTEKGYFEIPQQLEANPTQLEVSEINGSDLIQHFSSIISNQIGFTGSAFGGSNNYKDSRKNRSVGSFILQNVTPALKSMLVSSSTDLDFIAGIRFSQDEYTKFKNKYLTTALQLINQEFNPVQYFNNTVIISQWVGQILSIVNVSKEFSNAFSYSYMIANGSPTFTEVIIAPGSSLVTLTDFIDLTDPKNVLYIYDITNPSTEQLLVVGVDYEIAVTSPTIDIQLNMGVGLKTLAFYLYKNPLPAYIPSTPSKVGTYPTYIPRIQLDTSYAIPTNVIIGHDGSKTIAYGDYRDQLLLELEKRIYNFLQQKFRNEYFVPLRVESVKTGYFRKTRYSRDEFFSITESYINKWSAKYRANYRTNDWPTASLTTPMSELWKLYNYRPAITVSGSATDLPGNWKGVFQYYYDTYYPDTQPWAMLGFSEQPYWWSTLYGPGVLNLAGQRVWASTAAGTYNMYADLEAGIIREGPSAIYNPITLLPEPQPMWKRPGLSTIIPVDTAGEIIPVPTLFGLSMSGNPYAPYDGFDSDWVYGDGGPVEQAWMSTSAYAFNVQEFLYLMRPGPYGEYMWDTLNTTLSPGIMPVSDVMSSKNWQYVQDEITASSDSFSAWMRPKNKDQIVHAETVDNIINIRFGYQCWISDRILFLGKDITSTFGQKIRTLDVNLANKFAGFTNKDTTNTYIEAVTPGTSNNTLIIPSTNFDVLLHTSPPIATYAYSGVIVRALADGTFVVYGYDLLNSEFVTIDRSTDQLIDITVGGTPAEFLYFTPGDTYNQGDIVRYNGIYYVSLVTQTVTKFVASDWQKLKALPVTGGVSVTYKPVSAQTITRVPYGTIFLTVQSVFDFLISWGASLESQGWQFQDVNQDTNILNDWLTSAKQFLFWLNTNWAPDASIQLSPLANSATLIVNQGYPNDVETLTNGVYSILDKYGVAIPPNNTTTDRDGLSITVSPSDVTSGIYFLQINTSETEHVLIFDNVTNFNDVVYSPLLRARQQRLRFNGFRSNGWTGKMEAPGYLILGNQLIPNFDTIVDNMRYFYDPDVTIDNPSLEDLGRHLIGYESKSYLDNLQVSNDIQYLFYQGAIRQKGTKQALDKLFRSTKAQSNEVIKVYEEWVLKLGNFGNTIEQVSTEFILVPEQNTGEVLVARFNFIPSKIGFVKQINILNAQNTYTSVPLVVITPPDANPSDPELTQPLRQATAYIILDTSGRISRVDIIDPGYGYLSAPYISINSGITPHTLDKLYSVWQGQIIKDTTLDNIVNIDIDQTDKWTVRPSDPEFALKFPVTNNIFYPIPNAGYVNFNDVTMSSFNIIQTAVLWGTTNFNPLENNIVWIAKTFTEDWDVYKLIDITTPSVFDVVVDAGNNLMLRTDPAYLIGTQFSGLPNSTDFGNMLILQVIEAHATATIQAGVITDVVITQTGSNYDSVPAVTIITNFGTGATGTASIAGGQVTGITIDTQVGVITTASITIAPPSSVNPATNYTVGFTFNSVETANEPTHNYYDLVTLDGNPISSTDIAVYADFTKLMLYKTMRFVTTPSIPTYVTSGDKIWVDQVGSLPNIIWTVFKYDGATLTAFRQQEPLINSSLFESATVFATSGNELILLPMYDPFKNILPGPAKQNISYMALQDPARYNVTGDVKLFSENITFGPRQVGQLWWDLSDTRFVYYEQPMALDGSETSVNNLVYRRDHWAQIFPGSSVNIYEWVSSPVPPAQYTGTGVPKDITSYVQLITSNRFTNISEVKYYFWVLGATDKPNIENRTLSALDVARLLQSPKSQNFSFFAPIQQTKTDNSYMFYNVQEILAYRGNNIQLQYRVSERDDQKHVQWKFFREGDPQSLVTDQYWDKMVDSLCGYTKVLPVSNEYTDGIIVANTLPWDIYGWDIAPWDNAALLTSPMYGEILPVPDPSLSESEKYGISYRPRQGMFKLLLSARKVFVQSANNLLKHIPIRELNPSWNVNVDTSIYWTYTNWYADGFENSVPTIVYTTLTQANNALLAGQLQVGTILQVTNGTPDGRYILYSVVQLNPDIPTLSLVDVCIQNSAIKLLSTIYTEVNKYGLSTELRQLLNAFRTKVMINTYIVDQNELYFSMLSYVVSEQKNPDWVFKSSYIYIKEDNIPLIQDQLYIPDQIGNIIDFIVDSKPYHTHVRDYTSTYSLNDIAPGTAIDTMFSRIILQFGPDYPGNNYSIPSYNLEADVYPALSNIFGSNPLLTTQVDQFVSQDDVYTVIPVLDNAKKGFSQLFPYTFTFDSLNLNNPQTFITPYDVVGVRIGNTVLLYGQDYYVEYNNDLAHTYTIYFYNDPTLIGIPEALVWWDSGQILSMTSATDRNETADGYATDNLVINIDTLLPADISTGIPTPYVGWGDIWNSVSDPVAQILIDAGGSANIPWNASLISELLPNTISSKENHNVINGNNYYRNAEVASGILVMDLPAPTAATENLDVIRVYVDPITHPVTTNILPNPGVTPGVIWIGGERIEYRYKMFVSANTWDLKLVARGTMGTAPTAHSALIPSLANPLILVGNPVWVEHDNIMSVNSNIDVWDALQLPATPDVLTQQSPTAYTSITNVPQGGLWYSQTPEAIFLRQQQGISIP